jgi:hypothetical protein
MNCFTRATLRWLLRQDGIRPQCLAWHEAEPCSEKRACRYAEVLANEYGARGKTCDPDLADVLLDAALEHVQWSKVAAELLERHRPRHRPTYLLATSVN